MLSTFRFLKFLVYESDQCQSFKAWKPSFPKKKKALESPSVESLWFRSILTVVCLHVPGKEILLKGQRIVWSK